jgi:hypothetical protein
MKSFLSNCIPKCEYKNQNYLSIYPHATKFFNNYNDPYIAIIDEPGNIDFLETTILDNNYKNLNIFLYEPITTYGPTINFNIQNYKEFKCNELDSILKFKHNNKIKNIIVHTIHTGLDVYFKNQYPEIEFNFFSLGICIHPISERMIKIPYKEKNLEYKFWCGIRRYSVERHIIAAYMSNIKEYTRLSWYYKTKPTELDCWFDLNNWEHTDTEIYSKIKNGFSKLYKNKFTIDYNIIKKFDKHESHLLPKFFNNNNYFQQSCFCNIVCETNFLTPYTSLSEKTFNSLFNACCFILIAPPKSLELLKLMGFKTFKNYWDESYDQEHDHETRLYKVLKTIEYINRFTLEQLQKLFVEIKPILLHNHDVMKYLIDAKNRTNFFNY